MKLKFANYLLALGAMTLMVNGCSGDPGDDTTSDSASTKNDSINVTGVTVKGQSFMMPSPAITADTIKKSGALYGKSMLNPSASISKYSNGMKRSLNLGVYGADLGYITMYDNTGDAMEYYKNVVQLGEQLKITASFDPALMKRFNDNVGKKDSILSLVGEAYRRSDQFLRESDQDNTATMILAGGWIESLYFALHVYEQKPDDKQMAIHIGEQKSTAAGIVKVLQGLDKPEYADLIKMFQDLNSEYQNIEIKYTFAEPTHDEANHITTINGTTEVNPTPDQIKALTEKVTAIRNYIIN